MTDPTPRLPAGGVVGERWQVSRWIADADGTELYEALDAQGGGRLHRLQLYDRHALRRAERWQAFQRLTSELPLLLGSRAARIHALGVDGGTGRPYVVSEALDGSDLAQRIAANGPMHHGEAARLLCVLGPLLDELHAAGWVHGNLKPTNVSSPAGAIDQLKLTDVGAGGLRADEWGGTPGWCAPELLEPGSAPSPPADLYALGLLAFFVLTGHPAFPSKEPPRPADLREAQLAGLRGASARAATLGRTLDTRLDRWFWRALDPDPTRRFPSASELALAFGLQLDLELQLIPHERPAALVPAPPREAATPSAERAVASTPAPQPTTSEPHAPPPPVWSDAASEDDSIVAISVKPLLFAGDLSELAGSTTTHPAPTSAGAPPSPPPETPTAAPHPVEEPASLEPPNFDETSTSLAVHDHREDDAPPPQRRGSGRALLIALGVLGIAAAGLGLWWRGSSLAPGAADTLSPQPTTNPPGAPTANAPIDTPDGSTSAAPTAASRPPAEPPATDPTGSPPQPPTAEVSFECAPVACHSVFCNARRYDPGTVRLDPGKHTCKGAARGHGTAPVTLDLTPGQKVKHRFEMVPRPPARDGS